MKRIIFSLLLFASPVYCQITEESVKKMGEMVLLDCKEYGMESCVSRIIGMSACTYAWSVNQGTEPAIAQGYSDTLFSTMTKKHMIPFNSLFNPDDTIKLNIRGESIERITKCRSAIKKAIPVMYEAFNGKPLEEEKIDELTNYYPYWYLDDMERVKRSFL